MSNDFGQVGGGRVGVDRAERGQKADPLLLQGGLGIVNGVVETVEEHRNAVVGEGLDDLLEVFDGDLVGVAVGEFGERSEYSLLQFDHG